MLKCPELSKLPKSLRFSSILWKHQTPGSVSALLGAGSKNPFLDPSHPATKTGTRGLPQYNGKEMRVKIFPMALLEKHVEIYPFRRPFVPWDQRVQRAKDAGVIAVEVKNKPTLFWRDSSKPVGLEQVYPEDGPETLRRARLPECRALPSDNLMGVALKRAQRRVPMSFFITTSKARMGALRCTRRIITLRIKAALNLIVSRGAYYDDERKISSSDSVELEHCSRNATMGQPPVMQFNKEEAVLMGRKWILQGWSYVFSPTLEVYRMPYPKLIPMLRTIMTTLNNQAIELENKWLATSLLHEQRLSLQAAKARASGRTPMSKPPVNTSKSEPTRPKHLKSLHPPTPATAPLKEKPSFDSAVWRRELEVQLKLMSRNLLTKSVGGNLSSDKQG